MPKNIWTPDHHTHMWVFAKLVPQSWKHTVVWSAFVESAPAKRALRAPKAGVKALELTAQSLRFNSSKHI